MAKEENPNQEEEDIEVIDPDEESTAPKPSEDEVSKLKTELEELKKERLYLLADFDNFRKQAIRERSDLIKYGSEPVFREMLTVLDNLERAASTEITPETLTSYKDGIEMIVAQFKKVMERFGVEEINAHGQTFDPSVHEALSSEHLPELPANSVTKVLKKAYKLKGKVIRPAQVVVNTASSPSKKSEDEEEKGKKE